MKAVLKELYSLEIKGPLREFRPNDPENFAISVRMMIGPDSAPGAESFDLLVCTPIWIAEDCDAYKHVWGHQKLIVPAFDFESIERLIRSYCEHCVGDDWPAIARQLSLIGQWEFEGYRN